MGQNKNLTKKSIFGSYEFSGGSEGLGASGGVSYGREGSGSVPDWPLCISLGHSITLIIFEMLV